MISVLAIFIMKPLQSWKNCLMSFITKSRFDHEVRRSLQFIDDSETIDILSQISTSSIICDSNVTAHFVSYENRGFGIRALSVNSFPCCYYQSIPDFVIPCPDIGVSLWNSCPPPTVRLLNITNNVVHARIGE
jgi:hypothetical protein